MTEVPQITFSDGHRIPQLGFGTWQLRDDVALHAVESALAVGYRHIDTAAVYRNETQVGRALAASGLARDEVFLTSKIWTTDMAAPRRALETSLTKLGVERLDLYLIHWPSVIAHGDAFIGCWDALQELQAEGLVSSIGVSNFHEHHLARLRGATPVLDQIELHPTFIQQPLRAHLAERDIVVAAWSPLGRAHDLTEGTVLRVAEQSGRTPAQIVIRWHLQQGRVVIPRSSNPDRIAENFQVVDFELSDEQVALLDALDSPAGRTSGLDPDTVEF